jgi:hypothetical protein
VLSCLCSRTLPRPAFLIASICAQTSLARSYAATTGMAQEYDLVTLGAGSGGTRASRFAAQYYGAKVACVELPFGFVSSGNVGGVQGPAQGRQRSAGRAAAPRAGAAPGTLCAL